MEGNTQDFITQPDLNKTGLKSDKAERNLPDYKVKNDLLDRTNTYTRTNKKRYGNKIIIGTDYYKKDKLEGKKIEIPKFELRAETPAINNDLLKYGNTANLKRLSDIVPNHDNDTVLGGYNFSNKIKWSIDIRGVYVDGYYAKNLYSNPYGLYELLVWAYLNRLYILALSMGSITDASPTSFKRLQLANFIYDAKLNWDMRISAVNPSKVDWFVATLPASGNSKEDVNYHAYYSKKSSNSHDIYYTDYYHQIDAFWMEFEYWRGDGTIDNKYIKTDGSSFSSGKNYLGYIDRLKYINDYVKNDYLKQSNLNIKNEAYIGHFPDKNSYGGGMDELGQAKEVIINSYRVILVHYVDAPNFEYIRNANKWRQLYWLAEATAQLKKEGKIPKNKYTDIVILFYPDSSISYFKTHTFDEGFYELLRQFNDEIDLAIKNNDQAALDELNLILNNIKFVGYYIYNYTNGINARPLPATVNKYKYIQYKLSKQHL